MKKYIALIVCVILLFLVRMAKADDVDNIVGDKYVEHVGICGLDKMGSLVFTNSEAYSVAQCIVTYEIGNDVDKWVVLFEKSKPSRVVKVNTRTRLQTVVWAKNTT